MESNTLKSGRKIKGFFGIFDVLGYSIMIESMKDNLDGLIDIYTNILMDIDTQALFLEDFGKLLLAPIKTESFAFSDTFVLYQDMPRGPFLPQVLTTDAFLQKVCYLLRLAFERGIPLRGAVSYGEYYIQEEKNCFIDYPVIEAHKMESKQNWSGAALCKSAYTKLHELSKESMKMQGEFRWIDLQGRYNPLNRLFLANYPIPYYSLIINGIALCGSIEGIALRWDDAAFDSSPLNNITRIRIDDLKNIGQFVREKFEAHGKTINDKTEVKIKNTAEFLGSMQSKYLLKVQMDLR